MSMSSNPFSAAAEAPAPEAVEAEAVDAVWETPAATADDGDASVEEDDSGDDYGSFEPPEKKGKADSGDIPKPRFNKVIAQRNELRETLAEREVRLAAAEARSETLAETLAVVNEKYRENPGLLKFDATFMETFASLAETDAQIASVANRIKAAMNGETPVTSPAKTIAAAEEVENDAAYSDPAVAKILERDVKRQFTDVLTEHGVKPAFISSVIRDVLVNMEVSELADVTPADVVELAKVYAEETGQTPADFLLPKKGGPKPPNTASGRATATREGDGASSATVDEDGERVRPKNIEEWEKNRDKRFKSLARDLITR